MLLKTSAPSLSHLTALLNCRIMKFWCNGGYVSASDIVEELERLLARSGEVQSIILDGTLIQSYLLGPPKDGRKILAVLRNNPIRSIWLTKEVVSLPNGCCRSDLGPLLATLRSIETWQTAIVYLNRKDDNSIHRQVFKSMPHVKELTIQGGGFTPKWLQHTVAGLCGHPSLRTLRLVLHRSCHSCIASLVPELKVLKEICFGSGDHLLSSNWQPLNGPAMRSLLQTEAPLTLGFRNFNCTDQENWQALCEGVSLARISGLRFYHSSLGNVTVLREALVGSRLQELRIECCDFEAEAETDLGLVYSQVLGALAFAVPLMPCLAELVLEKPMYLHCRENPQELVELVHGVAKCNDLLRFRLSIFAYDTALDQAFACCLAKTSALKELEIKYESADERGTPKITGLALCTVLSTNYTIEKVALKKMFYQPWDASLLETVQALVLLNKAGRRYMASDPSNHQAGVRVLEQVVDNINCLFLHLRENPLLCGAVRKGRDSEIFPVQCAMADGKRLPSESLPHHGDEVFDLAGHIL